MTKLRRLIESGLPAFGSWLSLGSANVGEVLGWGGFDWLLIDGQHSAVGPAEQLEMVRAVAASGASPVVRVPANNAASLNAALDTGAHAVMVPLVSNASQARRVVDLATFPPNGDRSLGGYRAHHSFDLSRQSYISAGAAALIIVQIEEVEAVAKIDEILAVDGIDGCFVGPQDLTARLAQVASLDSEEPAFLRVLDRVVQASQSHGLFAGILAGTVEAATRYLAQGFSVVAVGTDARMLSAAARDVTTDLKRRFRMEDR